MAARYVLFALAAALVCGAALAHKDSHKTKTHKHGKNLVNVKHLAVMPGHLQQLNAKSNGLLDVQPHGIGRRHVVKDKVQLNTATLMKSKLAAESTKESKRSKRFLGLHIHRKHKVYLVNPQVPQQVVYIKKHRHHSLFHPVLSPVSVHVGHRHHHRHHHRHGVNVHLGFGR